MTNASNNVDLIRSSIHELVRIAGDDEAAHSFEDDLREKVLQDIASGKYTAEECSEFAAEVLKTSQVIFARWCA